MKSKACIMTFRPFNIPAVYSDDMLARLTEEFDMLPYICSRMTFPRSRASCKGRVYLLHMGNARAFRGGDTAISAEAEGCFLCCGYRSAVCASVYLMRS